jgi:hypothetical protein
MASRGPGSPPTRIFDRFEKAGSEGDPVKERKKCGQFCARGSSSPTLIFSSVSSEQAQRLFLFASCRYIFISDEDVRENEAAKPTAGSGLRPSHLLDHDPRGGFIRP